MTTTTCDETGKVVEHTVPIGTTMERIIDMLIVHVVTERKKDFYRRTAGGEVFYTYTKNENDEPMPLSVGTT